MTQNKLTRHQRHPWQPSHPQILVAERDVVIVYPRELRLLGPFNVKSVLAITSNGIRASEMMMMIQGKVMGAYGLHGQL